jgi:hypothetical protein
MNKVIAGLFAAALLGGVNVYADVAASAPAAKDLKNIVEEGPYVETSQKGIKLSGYVDAGYVYNFIGDGSINGRFGDGEGGGDFQVNAIKLTLEKALSDANELQAGFRTDIKIGEDADATGSLFGTNGGDLDVEQAYVIFRLPVGNGLDVSVGKFVSLLGYEVDDRPANLNITYGYDWVFVTTQQTGVKLYYPINDILEAQFAVSNGSGLDTSSTGAIGNAPGDSDGYAINGTINIKAPGGNANWFHGIYASFDAGDGFTNENEGVLIYNTWGNWVPKFANDKLLLGLSGTIGDVNDHAITGGGVELGYTFATVSAYAKYQFTDVFSLAGRFSYLHSSDDNTGGQVPIFQFSNQNVAANNGTLDIYSYTLTGGFNLVENLLLRAEYRVDFGNDIASDNADVAHTVAMQAVYSF